MEMSPDAVSCVCAKLDIHDLGRLACAAREYDNATRRGQLSFLLGLMGHVLAAHRLVRIGLASPQVVDTAFTIGGWMWQDRWELDLGGALQGDDAESLARCAVRRARAGGCARRRVELANKSGARGVRTAIVEAERVRDYDARVAHSAPAPRTPEIELARAHHRLQLWCRVERAVHEMLEQPQSVEHVARARGAVYDAICTKHVDAVESEMYTRYVPDVLRRCPKGARRAVNTAFAHLNRYYVGKHGLPPVEKIAMP